MYTYLLNKGEVFIIEAETPDGWKAIGDVGNECIPVQLVLKDGDEFKIPVGDDLA